MCGLLLTCISHQLERLNNTVREREKVMRGMQNNDTAKVLMDGFRNYYNFLRPHMGIDGKIPSEEAGITIEGDNKWLTLIQKSVQHQKNKAKSN